MESNGEQGKVNVSDATKKTLEKLIRHPYTFIQGEEVEIKALNRKVDAYFLELDENNNEFGDPFDN
jgi:hypothetical protein